MTEISSEPFSADFSSAAADPFAAATPLSRGVLRKVSKTFVMGPGGTKSLASKLQNHPVTRRDSHSGEASVGEATTATAASTLSSSSCSSLSKSSSSRSVAGHDSAASAEKMNYQDIVRRMREKNKSSSSLNFDPLAAADAAQAQQNDAVDAAHVATTDADNGFAVDANLFELASSKQEEATLNDSFERLYNDDNHTAAAENSGFESPVKKCSAARKEKLSMAIARRPSMGRAKSLRLVQAEAASREGTADNDIHNTNSSSKLNAPPSDNEPTSRPRSSSLKKSDKDSASTTPRRSTMSHEQRQRSLSSARNTASSPTKAEGSPKSSAKESASPKPLRRSKSLAPPSRGHGDHDKKRTKSPAASPYKPSGGFGIVPSKPSASSSRRCKSLSRPHELAGRSENDDNHKRRSSKSGSKDKEQDDDDDKHRRSRSVARRPSSGQGTSGESNSSSSKISSSRRGRSTTGRKSSTRDRSKSVKRRSSEKDVDGEDERAKDTGDADEARRRSRSSARKSSSSRLQLSSSSTLNSAADDTDAAKLSHRRSKSSAAPSSRSSASRRPSSGGTAGSPTSSERAAVKAATPRKSSEATTEAEKLRRRSRSEAPSSSRIKSHEAVEWSRQPSSKTMTSPSLALPLTSPSSSSGDRKSRSRSKSTARQSSKKTDDENIQDDENPFELSDSDEAESVSRHPMNSHCQSPRSWSSKSELDIQTEHSPLRRKKSGTTPSASKNRLVVRRPSKEELCEMGLDPSKLSKNGRISKEELDRMGLNTSSMNPMMGNGRVKVVMRRVVKKKKSDDSLVDNNAAAPVEE